jgi:hypothetical protein
MTCPKCGYPLVEPTLGARASIRTESSDEQDIGGSKFEERPTAQKLERDVRYDSLEIEVGRLIKTRVKVDPETIEFGRKLQRCSSVQAIGWWSQTTRNLEWAQNQWTTGWIWLKDPSSTMKLTVPGNQAFQLITEKIWKFVGIRLLEDVLFRLADGHELKLCGLSMSGEGLRLKKFGATAEAVPWQEVTYGIWDGKINISCQSDKWRKASISFRRNDNAPVLAALLELRLGYLVKG